MESKQRIQRDNCPISPPSSSHVIFTIRYSHLVTPQIRNLVDTLTCMVAATTGLRKLSIRERALLLSTSVRRFRGQHNIRQYTVNLWILDGLAFLSPVSFTTSHCLTSDTVKISSKLDQSLSRAAASKSKATRQARLFRTSTLAPPSNLAN